MVGPHAYSDAIYDKKVIILGHVPPPIGGVSVHIARVIDKLRNQRNTVFLFDTLHRGSRITYALRLCLFLLTKRPDVVIYQTVDLNSSLIEFKLITILKKFLGFTLMVVEHHCRHLYERSTAYKKQFSRLMHSVDHLVLIGSLTLKSYQDAAIFLPARTTIEEAFLPPNLAEEQTILASYPSDLFPFMARCHPLVLGNAFKVILLDGKDLYGLDAMLNALCALKEKYPACGLLIALARDDESPYFEQLREYIDSHDLKSHIYFLTGQQQLWPLYKRVDVFIRPTLSDGASVSVAEAQYFRVPTIASDVCQRPAGVITYPVGDMAALVQAIEKALIK